ncbi:127_t:CDS:1, partial [Funneliformis caledonium]
DYDEKEKHYRRSKRSPVPTDDGKKDDYDDNKVKYDPYYNPNLKSYDPYYNPWVPAKYYDHKDDNDDKKGKFYKRFNRSKRSKRSPVPT